MIKLYFNEGYNINLKGENIICSQRFILIINIGSNSMWRKKVKLFLKKC